MLSIKTDRSNSPCAGSSSEEASTADPTTSLAQLTLQNQGHETQPTSLDRHTFTYSQDSYRALVDAKESGIRIMTRGASQFKYHILQGLLSCGSRLKESNAPSKSQSDERLQKLTEAMSKRESVLDDLRTHLVLFDNTEQTFFRHFTNYLECLADWNAALSQLDVRLSKEIHRTFFERESLIIEAHLTVQKILADSCTSYIEVDLKENENYFLSHEELEEKIQETKQKAREEASEAQTLTVTIDVAAHQSNRTYMEDRWIALEFPKIGAKLCAIFDGHGGDRVSTFAILHLKEVFESLYKEGSAVDQVLKQTLKRLHEKLQDDFQDFELNTLGGSTAVMCFLDLKKGLLYTATLGDCAAFLWTKKGENAFKWVPLSVIYDWDVDVEKERLVSHCPGARIKKSDSYGPSRLRWKNKNVNISRAIGDFVLKDAISQEAVVTCVAVNSGDVAILGSDGMWDYNKHSLESNHDQILKGGNIAEHFAHESLKRQAGKFADNTTVVSMQIK